MSLKAHGENRERHKSVLRRSLGERLEKAKEEERGLWRRKSFKRTQGVSFL
jgi:hypothetical protein